MKKFFSYLTLFIIFAKAQEGFLIQIPLSENNQEKQGIKIGQEVKSPTPPAKSKMELSWELKSDLMYWKSIKLPQ